MAVALANAIETIEELLKRGYDIDWFSDRILFGPLEMIFLRRSQE